MTLVHSAMPPTVTVSHGPRSGVFYRRTAPALTHIGTNSVALVVAGLVLRTGSVPPP